MRVKFLDIFCLKDINNAYLRHVNSGIIMSWEDEIKKANYLGTWRQAKTKEEREEWVNRIEKLDDAEALTAIFDVMNGRTGYSQGAVNLMKASNVSSKQLISGIRKLMK